MNKELFPTAYSEDFESARSAYRPEKNDSKADAYKAWEQTKRRRMSAGAFGQRMVFCCDAYNAFLDEENARRRKNRQSDYPRAHMATWIRQARWEGFMPDAEARIAAMEGAKTAQNPAFTGWEAQADRLVTELTRPVVESWFADVRVLEGPVIEFPGGFKARWVAQHFQPNILRAFGPCSLSVAGKPGEKYPI